jgi:8-oxo-dGTP pyrophosphatase MutT (NUDIX family)
MTTLSRARVAAHLAAFEVIGAVRQGLVHAAVAVTLVDGTEPAFLITRRAKGLRAHASQWALPGGRIDAGETPEDAALRELDEEVGLRLAPDAVLGRLDDYITRSGYVITPVVVWAGPVGELRPNPQEVSAAYRVPLSVLDRPDAPTIISIPESDRPVISMPLFDGLRVHAPTAAYLFQLGEVCLHGRSTRVAHFDQPVFAWK